MATSHIITTTPVISAALYSPGLVVGGVQVLANALSSRQTGVLTSFMLTDSSEQKAPFEIFLFSSNPTASAPVDHQPFNFSTDLKNLIAHFSVVTTDSISVASVGISTSLNMGVILEVTKGTTLYAVAVTSGNPTYLSTSALGFVWGILQD